MLESKRMRVASSQPALQMGLTSSGFFLVTVL